jgi:hypothetical protein
VCVGSLGTSSHRWKHFYAYYYHAAANGAWDEYDDLAIVKQWGEKSPKIPEDYDKTKMKPNEQDVFSILRAKDDNGNLESGNDYDLTQMANFALCCTKVLAKKQDSHEETISAMYSEIELLREKVSQLETRIASAKTAS